MRIIRMNVRGINEVKICDLLDGYRKHDANVVLTQEVNC